MERAYKFRLYPTIKQQHFIQRTFGCCRFVYNHYLSEKIRCYKENDSYLSYNACAKDLTCLKKRHQWLKDIDSTALQSSLKDLENAYQLYFRRLQTSHPSQYPRFKNKHSLKQSYRSIKVGTNIMLSESAIKLPKLGWVKCRVSREIEGRIISVTVSRTPSGQYYASVLCTELEASTPVLSGNTVTICPQGDIIAESSSGKRYVIESPEDSDTVVLSHLCKQLSRKPKDSNRRKKAYRKMANKREHLHNKEIDVIHKFTTCLIMENDIIILKDTSDFPYSQMELRRQLKYKCEKNGKTLIIEDEEI